MNSLEPNTGRPRRRTFTIRDRENSNGSADDGYDSSYDSSSSELDQRNSNESERPRVRGVVQGGHVSGDENLSSGISTPGRLPMDVYDAAMSPWRAKLRRTLVRNVERESPFIARIQKYSRSKFLDAYFVYASSLGTHTFFMTMLPALFFFGYPVAGRGLITILAMGVYFSSFLKDFACAPRPFSPPVARLTIGTHHLEYGFPSTHSTNSVSIALFLFAHVYSMNFSPLIHGTLSALLILYVVTIVAGRIYTAMHSFADCAAGIMLGTMIWWVHGGGEGQSWVWGLGGGEWIERWIRQSGWSVPLITIPLGLLLVHKHPQPLDDCPCFEDAIAFISVVLGALVGRWTVLRLGYDDAFFSSVMPGSSSNNFQDRLIWWGSATLKMVFGILVIFIWRIIAKPLLLRSLPPIFRFLSHLADLPNRRFYVPATDYNRVPEGNVEEVMRRPLPSVLDLPGQAREVEGKEVGAGQGPHAREVGNRLEGLKRGDSKDVYSKLSKYTGPNGINAGEGQTTFSHYDADVLTKVVVYSGIAVLACEVLPIVFEEVGLGVKNW